MTIQWFPGHMQDTRKNLMEAVARIDVLFEILDARLPVSSSNPFVDSLCRGKPRIKILNKKDLADPVETDRWIHHFSLMAAQPAVAITGTNRSEAIHALNAGVAGIKANKARKIKAMVVGIPNTGKSTVLNTLAGKKVAKTGNVPAVTRHQQRTSLPNNVDIYDTPGILWPVVEPAERALLLAASGAVSDTAFDYDNIAVFMAELLMDRYPELLQSRYDFLDAIPQTGIALIEKIGLARGCLKKGGLIDFQKASEGFIRELRNGAIGAVTFETPEDFPV